VKGTVTCGNRLDGHHTLAVGLKVSNHPREMMLVPSTTGPAPAHVMMPAATSAATPETETALEPQEPLGPDDIRMVRHPGPMNLRGIPVRCSACRALRDWLLISHSRNVWVRCRCTHEWYEPELKRSDFDALIRPGGRGYRTDEEVFAATGFDGTLAGVYVP
jgi:hypothetical protein